MLEVKKLKIDNDSKNDFLKSPPIFQTKTTIKKIGDELTYRTGINCHQHYRTAQDTAVQKFVRTFPNQTF
jgi:hypothetical protein